MNRCGPVAAMSRSDLLVVAIALLSVADLLAIWYATWTAMALLLLALGALVLALGRTDQRAPLTGPIALAIPILGLTFALISRAHPMILQGIAFAGLGLLVVVDRSAKRRWVYLVLAGLLWIAVSVAPILAGPANIDVVTIQAQGGRLLLHGHDPYLSTYSSTTPGVLRNPFPYSPATAMLAALGAPLGDPRWVTLFMAVALVAILLALARHSWAGGNGMFLMAALFLLLAVIPRMVWDGWTDVYWLAPFSGWLLLRQRWRGSSTLLLAIAIGAKITVFPVLVPLALWAPRMRREIVLAAAGSGILIYLPFAIWTGPLHFWQDLVGFFASVPPRPGTLSLSGLMLHLGLPGIPLPVTAGALLLCLIWLLRREPRGAPDLLVHAALFTFAAFLFSPWANFNYWMAVVALLCAGVAMSGVDEPVALPWAAWRRGHTLAASGGVAEVQAAPD